MAPGRKRPRLGFDVREQGVDADPAVRTGPGTALEPRQHEQVGDEVPHALGLLRHQRDHALLLRLVERQVAQGLEEARQHGQRGAELVRDVGDEIAPHRLGALALGQVLRQDQLEVAVVAPDRHLNRARPAPRMERDGLVELAGLEVGDEGRRADQVGDPLAPVALRIEAEVIGRARVAPLDVVTGVEEQDAVRRRLHGRDELRQAQALGLGRPRQAAQAALDAIADLAPEAGVARRRSVLRAAQPAQQSPAARRVEDHDRGKSEHAADQRAEQGLAFAQRARDEASGEHRQQADSQASQQPVHRCRSPIQAGTDSGRARR